MRISLRRSFDQAHHLWLGLALVAAAFLLARADVEFVRTYFYAFAWYPALLAADGLLLRISGRSLILHRPFALISLLGWSLPFWLFYEAVNLRLENWYYVNTPEHPLAGRIFMMVSFATVLPGIVYAYLILDEWLGLERIATPRFRLSPRGRRIMLGCGLAMLVLPLIDPTHFYALIWGFVPLLLEPLNRKPRWHSLLRDLEFGFPRRVLLLTVAGALTGVYWEVMNVPAAAKWIYTVPFFDKTLDVEMPPLGFLGFIPFAWSAYSFLRFLEIRGLSVPFERETERAPVLTIMPGSVRVFALPALVSFASFVTVPAMERFTVDSRLRGVDRLESASRRDRAILELNGMESLAALLEKGATKEGREAIARLLISSPKRVEAMVDEARLATLRGIGLENAALLRQLGIETVEDLADRDADQLARELQGLGPVASHVKSARVRTWIRGAKEAVAKGN